MYIFWFSEKNMKYKWLEAHIYEVRSRTYLFGVCKMKNAKTAKTISTAAGFKNIAKE